MRSVGPRVHVADSAVVLAKDRRPLEVRDRDHLRLQPVVDVVGVISDLVGVVDDLRFERRRLVGVEFRDLRPVVAGRVLDDPLSNLPREIQAGKIRIALLQDVHDAHALRVVLEAAVLLHQPVQDLLAGVTERSVAEVVGERDRLGQVLVEPESARDRARDLGRLHRVRQAGAVVVAFVVHEDLGLVLQPAKRRAMDHTVAITLERQAERVLGFGMHAPAGALVAHRIRRQRAILERLDLTSSQHGSRLSYQKWRENSEATMPALVAPPALEI